MQAVKKYIVVGGGSRSSLWCQIIADVTGKPVQQANTTEAAALGAGILAAYAIGLYSDIPSAAQAMSCLLPDSFQPNPERYEFYSNIYRDVYSHLFPALQPYLDRMPNLYTKMDEKFSANV
jgi:xylulokinase